MVSLRPLLTATTAIAVTGLLLVGCSAGAGAGAGAQSTKQACKVLSSDLASSATELSTAFSDIQSDPKGAEAALASFDATLKKASAKVTNPKIKNAAVATSKAIDGMDSGLKAYIADPTDTAGLEASATKVQTTFGKLGSLCTA